MRPKYTDGCIENTILVSFDIKFIRQEQRRNGEACRASPRCFWSSLINWTSGTLIWFSINHASQEEFKVLRNLKK